MVQGSGRQWLSGTLQASYTFSLEGPEPTRVLLLEDSMWELSKDA